MLNRPLIDGLDSRPPRNVAWDWDAAPTHRLVWLATFLLVPLAAMGVRLADLQSRLQPSYTAAFSQTYRERVELPARDGRILAADGAVLADDLPQYDLLVFYRWLEAPSDPRWLRRKAWQRLARNERRKSALVAVQETRLRQEHEHWWRELAQLTGRPVTELQQSARAIQTRVEHIWETVQAHRDKTERTASVERPDSTPETPWWQSWWRRLQQELTQPPTRVRHEPLVVREQEQSHVLLANVSAEIAAEVEAHPQRYPGVTIAMRPRRIYPQRDVAPHLLGARTVLRPEELDPHAENTLAGRLPGDDYRVGDPLGRSGLERQYETVLHGRRGVKILVRNRQGEVVDTLVDRPAEDGRDLVLTIDLPLQKRAEELLDAALSAKPAPPADDESPASAETRTDPPPGGCLIALDVHTGAVLAAACAPRFDANLRVTPNPAAWQSLLADARKPLFPRTTQMALPPGSVFKAASAIALLESGVFRPHDTIACRGYLDQPGQHRCLTFRHYGVGHGETDLASALARSCNVYFFTGARRAGPLELIAWADRLGIGQPTGLDLPGETPGSLPSPESLSGHGKRWYPGDTLGLAIGQSSLKVTPLQIARLMAAIANDGLLVTPHLATNSGATSIDLAGATPVRPVFDHPAPQPVSGLHHDTLACIREGLYRVVHDLHGTGYKTVRLKEVAIAGKTGTAEVGAGKPDHAWFAGYAPADNPRVAFAVVIEHGGSGGKVAGPIAREFVRTLLDTGLITPAAPLAGP